jgi:alpha-beta hydrolase superfamily lysophospholipase
MPQLLDTRFPGFALPASAPKAALIIVHGLAEYAGRYESIARTLGERGVMCFAFDQRGHGDRPGVRAHVARFDDFVDDLQAAARAVRTHLAQAPLFIWGHSMGAIVATLAAVNSPAVIAGVITSSNSLEVFRRGPNPLNPFFRFAAQVFPRVRIPLRLDAAKISTDESVQRAYATDAKIPPTASLRLIVEFAAACERCREAAPQLTIPWLVVHGEADEIAPSHGSQVLFDRLGSADKKLVIYPGLRHEVHNEQPAARAAFLDLLTHWTLERAQRPSA